MTAEPKFEFVFANTRAAKEKHKFSVKSYRAQDKIATANQGGSQPFHHTSVKAFSRAKGHSAVAAAAYRSGSVLVDERTGEVHDYMRKNGTDDSFIIAPKNAPDWVTDRAQLWNEAERLETRKNAQIAREVLVALPLELNHQERLELVTEYVDSVFTKKGIVADVAMHDIESHNPHAHIMFTNRAIEKEGFAEKVKQPKDRKEYFENRKAELKEIRETWTELTNLKLEGIGSQFKIDHRSYKDRGIDQIPTTHLGKAAHNLKVKNEQSINVEINDTTTELNALNAEIIDLEKVREELRETPQNRLDSVTQSSFGASQVEYSSREQLMIKFAAGLLNQSKPDSWENGSLEDRKTIALDLAKKLDKNLKDGEISFVDLANKSGVEPIREITKDQEKYISNIASSLHDRGDFDDSLSYRMAVRTTINEIKADYQYNQIDSLEEHAESVGFTTKQQNRDFELGD